MHHFFVHPHNLNIRNAKSTTKYKMKWRRNRVAPASGGKTLDEFSNSSSNTESPPTFPGKDADFGTSAIVKTLYEGKNSYGGSYDWVDYPPK